MRDSRLRPVLHLIAALNVELETGLGSIEPLMQHFSFLPNVTQLETYVICQLSMPRLMEILSCCCCRKATLKLSRSSPLGDRSADIGSGTEAELVYRRLHEAGRIATLPNHCTSSILANWRSGVAQNHTSHGFRSITESQLQKGELLLSEMQSQESIAD